MHITVHFRMLKAIQKTTELQLWAMHKSSWTFLRSERSICAENATVKTNLIILYTGQAIRVEMRTQMEYTCFRNALFTVLRKLRSWPWYSFIVDTNRMLRANHSINMTVLTLKSLFPWCSPYNSFFNQHSMSHFPHASAHPSQLQRSNRRKRWDDNHEQSNFKMV